jgi:hypothetical protein
MIRSRTESLRADEIETHAVKKWLDLHHTDAFLRVSGGVIFIALWADDQLL